MASVSIACSPDAASENVAFDRAPSAVFTIRRIVGESSTMRMVCMMFQIPARGDGPSRTGPSGGVTHAKHRVLTHEPPAAYFEWMEPPIIDHLGLCTVSDRMIL